MTKYPIIQVKDYDKLKKGLSDLKTRQQAQRKFFGIIENKGKST